VETVDRSELELVRAIRKVLSGDAPGVVVSVGDDALRRFSFADFLG
jgi:hypothetical protein